MRQTLALMPNCPQAVNVAHLLLQPVQLEMVQIHSVLPDVSLRL